MPERTSALIEEFNQRTRQMVVALLAAGAVLLVVAIAMAARTMGSIQHDTDMVEHTQEVQATISQLAAQAERIETARRGYLIQPDAAFETVVRNASADFNGTLRKLAELISDNPVQIRRVEQLARLDAEKDRLIDDLFAATDDTRRAIITSDFNSERGVRLTRDIRVLLKTMAGAEARLLTLRNRNQLDSLIQFYLTGGIAFALLLLLMGGAILLTVRFNRDLTDAQGRLREVNENLEDTVAARTGELRRANHEIQRFAYIVSHDLRSPLVNVLGFTSELDAACKTLQRYMQRFAEDRPEVIGSPPWIAVEEDIPEALGFIRTSTEKMDRLINSILELSRQGRRPLRPEPLDMTELAEGVAATLHQRAEAAGAKVTVFPMPGLVGDRMAVEQMLANLTENAIKYLSPDRAGDIRIEGRSAGPNVEIDVVDNGRGIAPADHDRIFDLFRRAGHQDQPGEGIGLANVRALAYRVGGRIRVESELGKGSLFRLILPKKFVAVETA